ncbi:MAG: glycoside hydrolase family 16 protein [Chthoniobacter sp.]|uniref:glycoside hydrolase family 16 protein n=1 Tax=Chthoniobacter sp. TaxID=2510640 RepID=UPI0032A62D11
MRSALLVLFALVAVVCAEPAPIKPEDLGYHLAWSDEFDGTNLDLTKWQTNYAPKVHPLGCNGELQAYAPENAIVRDGKLRLRADHSPREGMAYTSGMVASHDKFSQHYGWFETRVKLPHGRGLWPAFWLLPESRQWPPEIDIMEHKGSLLNHVWLTVHRPQPNTWRPKSDGQEWTGPDFTADFHTFAVDWRPDRVAWFVDGIERHQSRADADFGPMYVILNLAVGGQWDGNPDGDTPFPATMEIDYVRVYRLPDGAAPR